MYKNKHLIANNANADYLIRRQHTSKANWRRYALLINSIKKVVKIIILNTNI